MAKKLTFSYTATSKNGKQVTGEIPAESAAYARAYLRDEGFSNIKVTRKAASAFATSGKKITPGDIAAFSRQLTTMIRSGVPMLQSLNMIASGHKNMRFQRLIEDIGNRVSTGQPLNQALRAHPEHFDVLMCDLIETGEISGALETILEQVSTYKEKSEALKRKIKKAMVYPISVLVVAAVVVLILLLYVVPKFEEIFKGFGSELPAFTQMVVNMSHAVKDHFLIILFVPVILFFLLRRAYRRSAALRNWLDRKSLVIPAVKTVVVTAILARSARIFSTTMSSGLVLVNALKYVAEASGNIVYKDAFLNIQKQVSTGTKLQEAMAACSIFPNLMVQMIGIGEEAGSLDSMLSKLAEDYEEQLDAVVSGFTDLIEPVMMSFLGVVIGGLVIAMYLPIFGLGEAGGGDSLAGCVMLMVVLFGLVIGSFLNVVILRYPKRLFEHWRADAEETLKYLPEQSSTPTLGLFKPRSQCPSCHTMIRWYENIPILSYLCLRGRCSSCQSSIHWQYPVVEALTAALTIAVFMRYGLSLESAAMMLLTWYLIASSVIDIHHKLLPDQLTLSLLWIGLLVNSSMMDELFIPASSAILGAVAGYVSLWSVYKLFKLVTNKEGIGYGDFKLFAAMGAWMGWEQLPAIVLIASLLGAIVGLCGIFFFKQTRNTALPFGPFLSIGAFSVIIFGNHWLYQYWPVFSSHL